MGLREGTKNRPFDGALVFRTAAASFEGAFWGFVADLGEGVAATVATGFFSFLTGASSPGSVFVALDRKSTRLTSSPLQQSLMPSSA